MERTETEAVSPHSPSASVQSPSSYNHHGTCNPDCIAKSPLAASHRTGSGNRIDFPTIACKICGDRSSGVHYGIISCEGCKGFFRRCLRRQKEYICVRGGNCEVSRQQRNRCPACRYRKCIGLGMSKEAVRIGRIPNKQKETEFADIEPFTVETEENHDAEQSFQELQADPETKQLTEFVIRAHADTSKNYDEFEDFLKGKSMEPYHIKESQKHKPRTDLNSMNGLQMWCSVVTQALSMYIKRIVTFCKCIPGFAMLDQQDQMVLIKAGLFEILTVQDSIELVLYDAFMLNKEIMITRPNMLKFMPQDLVEALYDFASRLHRLRLTKTELALLSAVVLYTDDRENLIDRKTIASMQAKLLMALKIEIQHNHRSDPHMFAKVLLCLPELRTVDNLHAQFIMKLQLGVGLSDLPIPALYKEVFDLGIGSYQNGETEQDGDKKNKDKTDLPQVKMEIADKEEEGSKREIENSDSDKHQQDMEQIALVGLSGISQWGQSRSDVEQDDPEKC